MSYSSLRFELVVISESRESELYRFQMPSSSDSSSSLSGSEEEESFYEKLLTFPGKFLTMKIWSRCLRLKKLQNTRQE